MERHHWYEVRTTTKGLWISILLEVVIILFFCLILPWVVR